MSLPTSQTLTNTSPSHNNSFVRLITPDNVNEFAAFGSRGFFLPGNLPCESFGVWKDTHTPAGYLRVLYRGAVIGRFRVKNIDAFIVNVMIGSEFRRNGYGELLMRNVLHYLHESRHINTAYLTVLEDNIPARRLYSKVGGVDERIIIKLNVLKLPVILHRHNL